ncbi:MAG: hypothetical protein ACR5K7_03480 [Symbiopectobacterium sp.]
MMPHTMLTGKTREHLIPFGKAHTACNRPAITAFTGLQQAATRDDFHWSTELDIYDPSRPP